MNSGEDGPSKGSSTFARINRSNQNLHEEIRSLIHKRSLRSLKNGVVGDDRNLEFEEQVTQIRLKNPQSKDFMID